ncbi:MAG TPA: ABC transporter ATP-binding protein [Thermomicrobiales bacterium]|nr:ABC transporter ATP-binding protein [Thermomicrobiales bacterium]
MSSTVPVSGTRRSILTTYTKPVRRSLFLLGIILAASIAAQLITPLLTASFINRVLAGAPMRDLVTIALMSAGVALIGYLLSPLETWVSEHVAWEATNALRFDLLAHLLDLDASFHARHTTGSLIERVDGDVSHLARFFSRFVVNILGSGVMMIGILVLLIRTDWRIGVAVTAMLTLAVISMFRIRALAAPAWARERQASAEYYGFLGDVLAAREDVRASDAVPWATRRATSLLRALYAATGKAGMLGYALAASTSAFFGIGAVLALAIGASQFRSGTMTLGAVYLVFQYTQMLQDPVNRLRDEIQDLQQADASLDRVVALFAEPTPPMSGIDAPLPAGPLGVAIDDVTFGYDLDDPVIHHLSVTIPAGRVLGIVGRTGSGKTTIARLLTRAWEAQSGTIRLVPGADAPTPLRDLRRDDIHRRIGLLTQDVALFGASLRDNLTLFDPSIPDERLLDILAEIGMDRWVNDLPDGLGTRLHADGSGLSAGQAQLIACARILLRDPDLIILDEASSRLDPATEQNLHRVFARLLDGRTGVVIAHRIDTLHLADDILVLEQGRVVECGPRAKLESDPASRFSHLVTTAEGALA